MPFLFHKADSIDTQSQAWKYQQPRIRNGDNWQPCIQLAGNTPKMFAC